MNRTPLVGLLLFALIIAVMAHLAVIAAAPSFIMSAAMQRISQRGAHLNAWSHARRVDETARGVVRPSPDLAYSACVYDLSDGPVRIHLARWRDYQSLSLYGADTDNYFVTSDREQRGDIDIVLIRAGKRAPATDAQIVESPGARGVAIARRLAPTPDSFAAADAARQSDVCAPLQP